MTQLNDTTIVLIVALTCSVLPAGVMVAFAAAISLAHMYALSMEVALVGLCAYLVLYLLYIGGTVGNKLNEIMHKHPASHRHYGGGPAQQSHHNGNHIGNFIYTESK